MRFKYIGIIALSFSLIFNLINSAVFAQEPLKIKLEYSIPKSQKIKLKITEIPKKYPWIERDDDGSTSIPEVDSIIVAENIDDTKIYDDKGNFFIIPSGTKFYAKLKEVKEPKSFWRKGEVKLDFYQMATGAYTLIGESQMTLENFDDKHYIQPKTNNNLVSSTLNPNALSYDSQKSTNHFKNAAENIGKTGAYAITGAILAPLAVYSISSAVGGIASIGAVSNPYVLGSAAAIGGGIGLIYGIKKEGKKFNLEPGKVIEIQISDPWLLTQSFDKLNIEKNTLPQETIAKQQQPNSKDFTVLINKIKQGRDEFGDRLIKISLHYKNSSNEELRLSSFQLLDSMGKEYEPLYKSEILNKKTFGELPPEADLDLYFSSDYPNAIHYLRVLRQYDQKPIFTTKLSIKK